MDSPCLEERAPNERNTLAKIGRRPKVKKHGALHDGDVFTIPFSEESVGLGQVLDNNRGLSFLVAIFEPLVTADDPGPVERIASLPVLLVGLTFPALVVRGDWVVIGSTSPRQDVFDPPSA